MTKCRTYQRNGASVDTPDKTAQIFTKGSQLGGKFLIKRDNLEIPLSRASHLERKLISLIQSEVFLFLRISTSESTPKQHNTKCFQWSNLTLVLRRFQ